VLARTPHGDLRQYATWIASQDVEAVRLQLGLSRVNLVGVSYGTRAALDYMRQFPGAVRRIVMDGVAPPDLALPAASSLDNQAALDSVLAGCDADAACRLRFPSLRSGWHDLLAGLPTDVSVAHPLTGEVEQLRLSRATVLSWVRASLYLPALAAALPLALDAASRGRFEPLLGLSVAAGGAAAGRLYEGLHFSIVCSEDVPRAAPVPKVGAADFGDDALGQYREVCADWPRARIPPDYFALPAAPVAALLLSGGADPATPPRHAARVVLALGRKARHVVVAQAGHGLLGLACLRDAVWRFVDAASDDDALQVDALCARAVPRPPIFLPLQDEARP
jgi:pimeloyl-ACP methyl ester carboxylesterase